MKRIEESPGRRALRMAAMTAGVTGSYLGYFVQQLWLGEDARKEKLKSTHGKAGRRVARELHELRGPAMKLGQLLSLQSGILPDETLAELAMLQRSAPGMHPSLVRTQFKAAMGATPEQIFKRFDEHAFAAASLGQVHRATTKMGDDVAVKIQYPGIRDAVKNDFRWFRTVSKASQAQRYFPEPLLAELEEQISAETDYRREAANVAFFRDALAPLEWVTVPRPYDQYSAAHVLTLSFVKGESLDAFLAAKPSQRIRDTIGERLLELYYFQVLRVEAFHADPHWGNYLFRRDGSLGLVDFGCVKYLTPKFVENLRAVFLYPGPRDSAEFRALLKKRYALTAQTIPEKAQRALVRFAKEFYGRVYPPEVEKDDVAIDFSDVDILRSYMRFSHELTTAKAALPEYVFLGRAEMGLYNTLHRLKARVHTSRIVRRYLAGHDRKSG